MVTRFNLGLSGQSADLVNALVEQGYKPKDVIYDALAVLDFAIQEIAAGKQFGSLDPNSETFYSLATPILQHVRRNPDVLEHYLGTYTDQDEKEDIKKVAAAAS